MQAERVNNETIRKVIRGLLEFGDRPTRWLAVIQRPSRTYARNTSSVI